MKLAWTKIALISLLSVIPLAADDEHASTSSPLPSHVNSIDPEGSVNNSLGMEIDSSDGIDQEVPSSTEDDEMQNDENVRDVADTSENDTDIINDEPNMAQHEVNNANISSDLDSSRSENMDETLNASAELKNEVDTKVSDLASDEKEVDVPVSETQDENTAEEEELQTSNETEVPSNDSTDSGNETAKKVKEVLVDYASKSTGAIILDKSSEFKGTSKLLVDDTDQYAIAPCEGEETKYVIIGLSEDILVKTIKLKSFERYSSQVKQFEVLGSQTYPMMTEWESLGSWDAKPWFQNNQEQTFELETPSWARYIKFNFLTHYGDEHYCTVTQVKVHGSTTLQGFHEMQWDTGSNEGDEQMAESETFEEGSHSDIDQGADISDTVEGSVVLVEDESNVSISDEEENSESTDEQESALKSVAQVAADALLNAVDSETSNNEIDGEEEMTVQSQGKQVDVAASVEEQTDTADTLTAEETSQDSKETSNKGNDLDPSPNEEVVSNDSSQIVDTNLKHEDPDESGDEFEKLNEDQNESLDEVVTLPESANMTEIDTNGSVLSAASIKTSSSKLLENSKETISSTVNSAIKSVKEVQYVNDAVQGLKDIIKAKVKSDTLVDDTTIDADIEETLSLQQDLPSDEGDEEKLVEREENDDRENSESADNDTVTVVQSESSLEQDDEAVPEDDTSIPHSSIDVLKDAVVSSHSELFELAQHYPSASCLETLTFQNFKSKAPKTGTTVNNPGSLSVPKNEPIFKKLADEIKILHINQGVYDQYIKAATKCYQQIISDMASEIDSLKGEHERRILLLEDKMRDHAMENERSFFMMATMLILDNIPPLWDTLLKPIFSQTVDGICLIGEIVVCRIDLIIKSKMVQGILSFLEMYRREVVSFLAGTLFCLIVIGTFFRSQTIRRDETGFVPKDDYTILGKSSGRRRRRKAKKGCSIDQQLPSLEVEELSSRE